MKKSILALTITLVCTAVVAVFSGTGYAAITGSCSSCHTMHNSQDGGAMAKDGSGNPLTTPYAHLTMSTCIGCHFSASESIPAPKIDGRYNVDSTAGGTFKDTGGAEGEVVASDSGVHNVDIALSAAIGEDDIFDSVIPGLASGTGMNNGKGSIDPNDLTCAGANGCHGDASIEDNDGGIRGFHHGAKSGWRYLQIADDGDAVLGNGAADWELAISNGGGGEHNVYSSDPSAGINKLCANCHPNFHGAGNTQDDGGNWIRHPTDNTIPATWEPTVDYRDNPFAFAEIGSMNTTDDYTVTNAQVACISCHRAHGSPYDDILRWNYAAQDAGSDTAYGCLGCHTDQRGS